MARSLGLSQSTVSRARRQHSSAHPRIGFQGGKLARLSTQHHCPKPYHAAYQYHRRGRGESNRSCYPMVLERLALRIQSSGRQLLFFINAPGKHVDDVLPSLLQYKVDSILIAPPTVSSRTAAVCLSQGIPVVLLNRYVPGRSRPSPAIRSPVDGRSPITCEVPATSGQPSCRASAMSPPIAIARRD